MSVASEGQLVASPEAEAARRAQRGLALRLGLAALLAIALGLLVDAATSPTDAAVGRRSWASPRADGFRACADLAARLGHRVTRRRASWGQLPAPGEHVLVVADPRPTGMWAAERAELDRSQLGALARWVEAGGRLVLTPGGRSRVALVDLPLGAHEGQEELVEGVLKALGWDLPGRAPAPLVGPLEADPPLPLAPGALAPLEPSGELLAAAWLTWRGRPLSLADGRAGPAELPVFVDVEDGFHPRVTRGGRPFVLERDHGRGRVWLLASAYPLTGLALAEGGAAPLVAGLLHEATEGQRRALLLDERAQGFSERRGLLGPLAASGFGAPLLALAGVALLVAWRGAVRDGPPRPSRGVPRRAKEEFVVALGDLTRQAGHHRAAGRWLVEAWRDRLPPGADPAELELAARRPAEDDASLAALAGDLRAAAARAAEGREKGRRG
ncbi:MAG: DUF4350 domain-containing protein [Planctomycetes bacterium]|nr:DUF4350 domain-containing protein [Planctomycetota bacterium]